MHRSLFRTLSLLAGTCLLLWVSSAPTRAATIQVAAGEVDVDANGQCSLREALANAEFGGSVYNMDCTAGSAGPDTVVLATGTYVVTDEVAPGSGLRIDSAVFLDGNGSTLERDSGTSCSLDGTRDAGEYRLLDVEISPGLTVELQNLTLTGGCADGVDADGDGGGVRVSGGGSLSLVRVEILDNRARGGGGGLAAFGDGIVAVERSTFADNLATGPGGAAQSGLGVSMTIESSTIVDNTALAEGGGVHNLGTLALCNSTISGNGSAGDGGALSNPGTATLEFVTVRENTTAGVGLAAVDNTGSMQVKNSIIGDHLFRPDCSNSGTFEALGTNFDTSGSCAALAPEFTEARPSRLALAPAADNGGVTLTHGFLGFTSVAVDAATDCTRLDGLSMPTMDQRGFPRPADGDGDSTAVCDVGALELQPVQETLVVDGICTLGDAIEAANLDLRTVGGCVDEVPGADRIVLDVDVVLSVADTVRSTPFEGSYAALPDVTSEIHLQAGLGDTIERAPAFDCDPAEPPDEFRLLQVSRGGILVLDGLTLANGCAESGGAVLVDEGQLHVSDGSFVGNTARSDTERPDGGAVLLSQNTTLATFFATRFEDNQVRSDSLEAWGGALSTNHPSIGLRIVDSEFRGNSVTGPVVNQGGAVYAAAQALVDGSQFEGNTASGELFASGGALAGGGGSLEIVRSRFLDNAVSGGGGFGGAVNAFISAPANLRDVVFVGNSVYAATGSASGGALYVGNLSSLVRAVFRDNSAQGADVSGGSGRSAYGGAVNLQSVLQMDDVTLVDNLASGGSGDDGGGRAEGGGMYAFEGAVGRNLTISGNRAVAGSGGTGVGGIARGGGIFLGSAGASEVSSSTWAGNAAVGGAGATGDGVGLGGGVFLFGPGSVPIGNSLFEGNTAVDEGVARDSECDADGAILDSLGFNLLATAAGTCSFAAPGDQTGVGPSLLSLGDHGCVEPLPDGSCLPTHPIAMTGPALDQGSCPAGAPDARGASRPWDHPGTVDADDGCDPGAYESRDADDDGVEDGRDCDAADSTNACAIFADDFESGNTSSWSSIVG